MPSNTPRKLTRIRPVLVLVFLGLALTIATIALPDQVIPDDLIVQGSECVGFDCVNNENFGFDTIKLKENNLRIKFEDTSTTAGFPSNDWQLLANDSASGGIGRFSIEDVTGARIPFTITAGAPTDSIRVGSGGKVGLRTAAPVLDLHINAGDTPAMRLEQNNSSGFTAQTWDIAGNEANFFVRDVTGGSRLPLRIRPGAPTSSIDINSSGNVGLGTASPISKLHVLKAAENELQLYDANNTVTFDVQNADNTDAFTVFVQHGSNTTRGVFHVKTNAAGVGSSAFFIEGNNNIGMGTTNPQFPLHMASGAHVTAGGVWTDASSRDLKERIAELPLSEATDALSKLTPVTYAYKAAPRERHVGFIAEDVPALVATEDRKGLAPMDVVAVLTKVVQDQQKTIRELNERVAALEQRQASK